MQIGQVLVGNTLYPLTEGQSLPVKAGDTIKVFYTFSYKMPKITGVQIWASVYKYTLGFLDRQGEAQTKKIITLEKALEWQDYSGEIDIIVGSIGSGTYGLICELPDHDEEAKIDDCLEVTGLELIQDYLYPLASTYNGNVEECTFIFSLGPEQIPGTDWFRDQIINGLEDEVTKEGARMIKLQVWEDTTPLWHTDYKVIATATASPVHWLLIIGAVLVILFLVAITFTIIKIVKFVWGVIKPILPDIVPLITLGLLMVVFSMITPMLKEGTK